MTTPRTVLIAGASRGLGLGLAAEFAGRGMTVIATERTPSPALAALHGAHPDRIEIAPLDIADAPSVAALRARLAGRRLDLVIVNAGISEPADVARITPDELAHLFLTNAVAPIRLARALLDHLAPGGVLALMSSRLGSVAFNVKGGTELYRASKAALNSLTRSLAATDGAGRTIVTLHPGWVRTDMGGPGADLDTATSVRGMADVLESRRGRPGSVFLDYSGAELPW